MERGVPRGHRVGSHAHRLRPRDSQQRIYRSHRRRQLQIQALHTTRGSTSHCSARHHRRVHRVLFSRAYCLRYFHCY